MVPIIEPLSSSGKVEVTSITRRPRKSVSTCFSLSIGSPVRITRKWLEVSSVSNFESFQANRLKLRYRDGEKKIHLAHTLNGSSLALPRIVAALLENFQTPEGIRIPEVLIPYTGFDIIK